MGQYSGRYGYVEEAKWIKTRTTMYVLVYGVGVLAIVSAAIFVTLAITADPLFLIGLIGSVIMAVISGGVYTDTAVKYHSQRMARANDREDDKLRVAREAEQERFDNLCKPWNVILRDPQASKEEKSMARDILSNLAQGRA